MIKDFSAINFRGFHHLRIDGLATINVIVGRSGAGKTALLEAVRLSSAASPNAAWSLAAQRGVLVGVPANPTRRQYETPWLPLFTDFDDETIIVLESTDFKGRRTKCKIFFDKESAIGPDVGGEQTGNAVLQEMIYPLTFERSIDDDPPKRVSAPVVLTQQPQFYGGQTFISVANYQMQIQNAPDLGDPTELLQANTQFNMQSTAQRFSELSIAGATDEIEEVVRAMFPEIASLRTETPTLGSPALYATTRSSKIKVPISLYSAGISKFIALLVELETRPNSILLIDEIENGIWFKILPELWQTLARFAVKLNTQLFISTHSMECLRAALPTVEKSPHLFSMLRAYNSTDGSAISLASGNQMANLIESGLEVRI